MPDPQRASGGEEGDAKPATGLPVEGPPLLPVRVGRQIGDQQTNKREGYEDPAVATILALAGAQIPGTPEPYARQREGCDGQGDEGRLGEEGGKPAFAEDGKPEEGQRSHDGDERNPGVAVMSRNCSIVARKLASAP